MSFESAAAKREDVFANHSRVLLCPSILSADLANLASEINALGDSIDMIHCDVMDGHFVPNLTFGSPVIKSLSKRTDKQLDVHLMVTNPDRLLKSYAEAGASTLVVHQEVVYHAQRTLSEIRALGCYAGISLNPATPLETIQWLLPDLDMILLMSVNPGFGGQSFIPQILDKIKKTRAMIDASGLPIRLQVDGGVTLDNVAEIVRAGADMIVAGSAVFGQESPKEAAEALGRAIRLAKAKL
ncbi:MAG: ribulose-phosphate 3-epimerase [Saccharofermentanales bacterium]|jgi:ribulose-phosphate 3-epimerase